MLEVQWLELLGPVVCNWKQMTMEFQWEGRVGTLQGIKDQSTQSMSLRTMSKEFSKEYSMFAICRQILEKEACQNQ